MFLLSAAPFLGADEQPAETKPVYEAEISGTPSDTILETLKAVSDTLALRDEAPTSRAHLRRRTERDRESFLKVLHSQGYYGARVQVEFDEDAEPLLVHFMVDAGNPYLIKRVAVETVEPRDSDAPSLPEVGALGLQTDEPLRAAEVLNAEARLLGRVKELGYPFPEITEREVLVDHATEEADVTFHLDMGPRLRFGEVRVMGLADVAESFIRTNLGWDEGDWFKASLLSDTQTKLYKTRLFSVVRLEVIDEQTKTGRVPINIELVERKHRTIEAGLRFHTDTGLGALSRWEHRNIQGLGRVFALDVGLGQTEQGLGTLFVIPFYRRDDQRLIFRTEARREDLDAYLSTRLGGMVAIERMLTDHMNGRVGIAYRFDRVEQKADTNSYNLLSFPASIEWTTVDSALDPTTGIRASVLAEPFVELTDPETVFLKTEATLSHYVPVTESRDMILALRMKLGMVTGAGRDAIPPDERFYAGGGGSVRGYPYRTISPLDDDDPIGGRSLIESTIEVRKKITEAIGLVVFVDGGTVSESPYPDFSSDYRLSAGMGARYYSPVGPLRLDVAIPLNRRSEIDNSFEIYVSLGQAF
ncbi:MAG: autotransporter assembly complex family protein [Candidatus Hydrogenedentota bacterium]